MKTMFFILIGVILFSFGTIAQAEDPYAGTYTCSGDPKLGCGTCADFAMAPPTAIVVIRDGSTYKFCPKFDDSSGLRGDACETSDIQNGKAHWSQHMSADQLTIDAKATATFNGSSLSLKESGTISGKCNCDFSLKALCTK